MERLESKKINGNTYYYYSEWGWVDGKCRRLWQKYLGKPKDIADAVAGGGPRPLCAEVFKWGLPMALWKECCTADVISRVDRLCPKREQGLTTGQYLAIAALNRAIQPGSKRSMWQWFADTALLRQLPQASEAVLASQRFWDHMDRIDPETCLSIWKDILRDVTKRENIDLASVSYDGTNFYTFIDTFNSRCELAQRGKNKQGRCNLRQVSYALFCCADGHVPLYYDVYEGNAHDAKQFPVMVKRFHTFFREIVPEQEMAPQTTIIFDKGNNSPDNFALLDSLNLQFVGAVKLNEHKQLAEISNQAADFVPCAQPQLVGTKAFRVNKKVYGRQRVLVVTYNQNLFNAQWLTLQNDMAKAMERLAVVKQKLQDRSSGIIRGGKMPTIRSIDKQCQDILSRQYMKRVIQTTTQNGPDGIPQLEYGVDTDGVHQVADTYLGKNILITNREDWDDAKIIQAYRSQFIIENVFKEIKDRNTGSWWPLHHWTDSKIRVHGLYCTIAILLRALMLRRVKKAGLALSMRRLLSELNAIRQVVNIYPRSRRQRGQKTQTVLTRTTELQQQLIAILGLDESKLGFLG